MNYKDIALKMIDYYQCDDIWFSFTELDDKVVIKKIKYVDGGEFSYSHTSYSYDELQRFGVEE